MPLYKHNFPLLARLLTTASNPSPRAMSTTTPEFPTHTFPTAHSFSTFLSQSHATIPGIYVRLAKKASGIPSITAAEAVEVALCYGWIDGRANRFDDNWWTVRYTPRRAKSIWSQKNVATVARLIEEGRMKESGLKAVEAAKEDGRWARAYAGSAKGGLPEDFGERLKENRDAEKYFEGLSEKDKYSVVMQLASVVEKNRERKIEGIVQGLARGEVKSTRRSVKNTNKIGADKVAKEASRQVRISRTGSGVQKTSQPRREGLRSRT
jgi:uncharacterized protein YdeI (YjbR/CyaY-like superfamily)